jgi:hypothetical protein
MVLPWVNSLLPFFPFVVINASEVSHVFQILIGTCLCGTNLMFVTTYMYMNNYWQLVQCWFTLLIQKWLTFATSIEPGQLDSTCTSMMYNQASVQLEDNFFCILLVKLHLNSKFQLVSVIEMFCKKFKRKWF